MKGKLRTDILTHSFNRWTGMCRCGAGPFITSEWVDHYNAQDEPFKTIYKDR